MVYIEGLLKDFAPGLENIGNAPELTSIIAEIISSSSRGATKVIAASDSSDESKQAADYVCDGVDDQVETLAAIDALPASGGEIILLEGTFELGLPIGRRDGTGGISNNVSIKGTGSSTILKPKNQAFATLSNNANIGETVIDVTSITGFQIGEWIELSGAGGTEEAIYIQSIAGNQITLESPLLNAHGSGDDVYSTWCTFCLLNDNIRLSDFTIDGNTSNWVVDSVIGCAHQYEIFVYRSDNSQVENINIINGKRAAICCTQSSGCSIKNCNVDSTIIVQGNECDGGFVEGCTIHSADLKLENAQGVSFIGNSVLNGRLVCSSPTALTMNATISGNVIKAETGTQGLSFNGMTGSIVDSNVFYECDQGGIDIQNFNNSIFSNNQIVASPLGAAYRGMFIRYCDYSLFTNNHISGTWFDNSGVYFDRECTNSYFLDNYLSDSLTIRVIDNNNTGLVIRGNVCGGLILNSLDTLSYKQYADLFMDLLAASTTAVHAAITGTGAELEVDTAITNPDVPRNVSITNSANSTGDVIITGVDAKGNSVTDTITISTGGTAYGIVAFSTVSEITIPATVVNPDTITVGVSDKLGLSNIIYASGDVYKVKVNNADDPTIGTVNTTYHTVDCATINAADDITIWYKSNLNFLS